jgi:hypothetical protein
MAPDTGTKLAIAVGECQGSIDDGSAHCGPRGACMLQSRKIG